MWTGGYISKLRRTQIWNLDIKNAIELENIEPKKFSGVKKILNTKYFLEKFNSHHIKRLDNWLERIWKFELEINIPYFIYNWEKITNIVKYDGEKLIPMKKVC